MYPPSTPSPPDQDSHFIFVFICLLSYFFGTVYITWCCSPCFSDEYGFWSHPSALAVAFGPEVMLLPTEGFLHLSLGNRFDRCRLLFSFLQFTADLDRIYLFPHEIFTNPLSRSAQAPIPKDDAKMKVQIDSFCFYTISFAVSFHFFSSKETAMCSLDIYMLLHCYEVYQFRGRPSYVLMLHGFS
jgi:hypothetical protein